MELRLIRLLCLHLILRDGFLMMELILWHLVILKSKVEVEYQLVQGESKRKGSSRNYISKKDLIQFFCPMSTGYLRLGIKPYSVKTT